MFNSTLIIDDDTLFSTIIRENIEISLNTTIDSFDDYNVKIDRLFEYDLYIIRLDIQTESIIKKLSDEDKFIIITTNYDNKETREKILSLHVADYVVTNAPSSATYIAKVAKRLESNEAKRILIVDDSKIILLQIAILLGTQNINYVQCRDGKEAWDYLNDTNSQPIDLVVTDYEMPKMNGYELVKQIRTRYSFEELPVLVLSGTQDTYMISRFLKVGANDYITKPFINEEFMGRVTNALLVAEMFNKIKNMAMTDQLTGIHNRLYFYETATKVLNIASRSKQPSAIAMVDIDNFKNINDTFGHEVGDRALIHIVETMKNTLRSSDIFVRFGGEEFVILLPNCPHDKALYVMQKVCDTIEKATLHISSSESLKITVSIGITSVLEDIDIMIDKADKYMYYAKQHGKNQVYTQD